MRKILVIIDGLGDIGYDKFHGKTPLEYADTPNLDELGKKSKLVAKSKSKKSKSDDEDDEDFGVDLSDDDLDKEFEDLNV